MTHAEMVAAYRDGRTFQAIGKEAGVSRQRVQQIIGKYLTTEDRQAIQRRRRRASLVSWKCRECDGSFLTRTAPEDGLCGIMCRKRSRDREFYEDPTRFMYLNRTDGHYWVRHPDGRKIRVERALAEVREGRKLARNEWVTLIDGDPTNLDPSNIEITSPAEIARRQREEAA